jgi:predicted DNA-binding transcriptional regulator AlpA
MSTLEDLFQAVMAAPADRRNEALRVLRGQIPAPVEAASTIPTNPEPYLTLRETAKRLGISTATLWRWKVPGHELAGRPRFRISEVEAYLQSEEFKHRAATLRAMRQERTNRETASRPEPAPAPLGRLRSRRSPAAAAQ